jgi:bacillithiol system protein YtxJ
MEFFSAMKKAFTNDKTVHDSWNVLTEQTELKEVREASRERPQLVYKHSFTCGICHMALENIEASFDELEEKADMNFVDVKNARPVSNLIAEKLDVRHESPQVIIMRDGKAVWDESHHAIKGDTILEALEGFSDD